MEGLGERRIVSVTSEVCVFTARRAARRLASLVGFGSVECEELVIVVSELSSNIVKYGIRGHVALERIEDRAQGEGIRVEATDIGPPIRDLATAVLDGHGDSGPIDPARLFGRKGHGGGLGAVLRLTDSFAYDALEPGKRITVVRYRSRQPLHRRLRG